MSEIALGYASCNLEPLELDEHTKGRVMMLTNLYTSKNYRQQGYARQLLTHLGAKADTEQFAILLNPKSDEIVLSELIAMYAKFGYEQIQDEPLLLARFPQPVADSVTIKAIKLTKV
jgi:GNAT superfamily N-acetyltransferase